MSLIVLSTMCSVETEKPLISGVFVWFASVFKVVAMIFQRDKYLLILIS